MNVALRSVLFTLVVPGAGAVGIPWWILTSARATPTAITWPGVGLIGLGAALYLWCLRLFATVGRGTPGPWDAPRRVVVVGPYRWVRNPIYLSALTVVVGEACLFLLWPLLAYAGVMAIGVHAFVVGYEEPTLERRFGATYAAYRKSVPRWLPRPPERV
jgi:protein-S-isoprenylcysteine O-methyltransferase Ste14